MKKISNKSGFSLVELIIVIAIMAVLVGVLAPQYLKYVEKARVQRAITNTETIAQGILMVVTDAAAFETDAYTTLMNLAQNGSSLDLTSDAAEFLRTAMANDDIDGEVTFYMSSDDSITFTYTNSEGNIAVDYNYIDTDRTYIATSGEYRAYYVE